VKKSSSLARSSFFVNLSAKVVISTPGFIFISIALISSGLLNSLRMSSILKYICESSSGLPTSLEIPTTLNF